jgi:hypothetical protein
LLLSFDLFSIELLRQFSESMRITMNQAILDLYNVDNSYLRSDKHSNNAHRSHCIFDAALPNGTGYHEYLLLFLLHPLRINRMDQFSIL